MKADKRSPRHRRDEKLEDLLAKLNGLLAPLEMRTIRSLASPRHPIILIFGVARSGTTLLLQWLAASGRYSYPSNLLSRFYAAPHIGAMIQQVLTRLDFRGEVFDFNPERPFQSELGKTRGALAPHEFWYFWRRFLKPAPGGPRHDADWKLTNTTALVRELAAIESVFNKPLALKAMIFNWHIPALNARLPRLLCLFIRRQPFFNIQSLLEARQNYFGTLKHWYSFKPPEYKKLRTLDPIGQVAGQVFYTNRAIERGLEKIPEANRMIIEYEAFCRNPRAIWRALEAKMHGLGFPNRLPYRGPASFTDTNEVRVSATRAEKIINGYRALTDE